MANKFVVHKGIDNEYTFTVKKNGSIEAIVIGANDTFIFNLIDPKTGLAVFTTSADVLDTLNGKIKVTIPSEVTTDLVVDIGDRCDYYKRKVTYKGNIECNTVDNGKFIAVLDKVYVE